MSELRAAVGAICDDALAVTTDEGQAAPLHAIRTALDGPLRVALAGKVKAGKSTLLNALVGERLAPTDAGECTRLVTRYEEGLGYEVHAVLRSGERRELAFRRDDGELDVDLGDLDPEDVAHLDVGWPSSALRGVTLIDTPGLGSLRGEISERTIEFLTPERSGAGVGQADAVLYLMRHLHRNDAGFLETFTDRSIAQASPVNAIAVLSRADEIGAGRPDAMDSAGRIAARYRADPRLRSLASTVVPVAGLVAETGLTLRQEEYGWLVAIAGADPVTDGSLSVDRFATGAAGAVGGGDRRALLERLGLYGIRLALAGIRDGSVRSAPALASLLVEASGLQALRDLLQGHFLARAEALKARTALAALRHLAPSLPAPVGGPGGRLLADIERIEAGAYELGELRLVHLVLSGATSLGEDQEAEVRRVTWAGDARARLGLEPTSPPEAVQRAALEGVDRWRTLQADPLADPVTAEACELTARAYERLYAGSNAA